MLLAKKQKHIAVAVAAACGSLTNTVLYLGLMLIFYMMAGIDNTAVLTAIGGDTQGSEFERMDRLNAITGVPVPKPLAELRGKPQRHTDVIAKDKMMDFVLSR